MTIPVLWHIANSFWDSTLPRYILDSAVKCEHISSQEKHSGPIAAFVVPGQHSGTDYDYLNEAASHYGKVVWIITGDEEGKFRSDWLKHSGPRRVWWFCPPMMPQQEIDVPAPFGWTTDTIKHIAQVGLRPRKYDWSFYGQMTHIRRVQCVEALKEIPNGDLHLTEGFAQGVPQDKYFEVMVQSKIIPCPSGPCSVDSFRFAEALEAGCVPIVDNFTPNPNYPPGYWNYLFGPNPPFEIVGDWRDLPKIMEAQLRDWPTIRVDCMNWWHGYKMKLIRRMAKELQ